MDQPGSRIALTWASLALAALAAGCTPTDPAIRADAAGRQILESYRMAPPPNPARRDPSGRQFAALGEVAEAAASVSGGAGDSRPEAWDAATVPLRLEECLRRALENNTTVQVARYGPAMAETVVDEAEALFDPTWYMSNMAARSKLDAGSALLGANTLVAKQWDFASGLGSLLPTGAMVSLEQAWTYLESNSAFVMPNPQYDTTLGLALTQPLLRDAGPRVTQSPIVLARLDRQIAQADFEAALMDTLLAVERAYWDLAVAQEAVAAVEEALAAARENLRIARLRYEAGKDPHLVVSLAASAVETRQADLLATRLERTKASDRLKRLLGAPGLPLTDPTLILAADLPLPNPPQAREDLLTASLTEAMKLRPELAAADTRVQQAEVLESVARNARLPRVDLVGGYGVRGLDGRLGNSLDEGYGTEFFEWQAGVEFEVPLGNRARRAAHERAALERGRAAHQREDLKQAVLLDVSQAVRDVTSAQEQIAATRAAREAAAQTLADQQANVTAGAALVKDLLEAQRDLAEARVREVRARATYMRSLAALERAKGSLLRYNRVQFADALP